MTSIQEIFGPAPQPSHVTCILLGGYLAGCLTTGYYLVKLRLHQDIRDLGSGSVGARNAGRVLGAPGFLTTMMGDFAKGALAVWAARYFTQDERLVGLALLAVVVGHIWPLQLGFRGGKGVATSFGALMVYDYHLAFAFIALFLVLAALLRRVTPGGLLAFVVLPMAAKLLDRDPLKIIILSVLALLIVFAHRRNLIDEIALLAAHHHDDPKPDESLK